MIKRELDETDKTILRLYCTGLTFKEIASQIFLSPDTIKGRIQRMKFRLDCTNVAQLIWENKHILENNTKV